MRLSLRFLIPLLVALALFAYAAVPLVDTLTTRWFVRDLDMRSNAHRQHRAGTARGDAEGELAAAHPHLLPAPDQRRAAVRRRACASPGRATPIATGAFPGEIKCGALAPYLTAGEHLLRTAKGVVHVAVRPLATDTGESAPTSSSCTT